VRRRRPCRPPHTSAGLDVLRVACLVVVLADELQLPAEHAALLVDALEVALDAGEAVLVRHARRVGDAGDPADADLVGSDAGHLGLLRARRRGDADGGDGEHADDQRDHDVVLPTSVAHR